MEYFVRKGSIVRKIWGNGDTVLFVFAGAAAEFSLNKAVDWLYYTGKLPADPMGRLFSTALYARQIVFAKTSEAEAAIDKINHIHQALEKGRGYNIPDWAYRDVLYMLIHYSIAAFEALEKKLSDAEKNEVYDVFYRMGQRMQLKELPPDYKAWLVSRNEHLQNDLVDTHYTYDLYKQYKKHLGAFRFFLLIETQKQLCPERVLHLLQLKKPMLAKILLPLYKVSRRASLDGMIKSILLPADYKKQISDLDVKQT